MPTSLSYPCQQQPALWIEPADTPWSEVPTAQWAATQCRTRCPRRTACATEALTAGRVPELSRHEVASGVIMGGVICDGTEEALTALKTAAGIASGGRDACRDCHRRFVPARTPVHQGGVIKAANGRCRGCYTRARRTGLINGATRPRRCGGCDRPMTSRWTREPGLVAHGAHGLCQACYRSGLRAVKREEQAAA